MVSYNNPSRAAGYETTWDDDVVIIDNLEKAEKVDVYKNVEDGVKVEVDSLGIDYCSRYHIYTSVYTGTVTLSALFIALKSLNYKQ